MKSLQDHIQTGNSMHSVAERSGQHLAYMPHEKGDDKLPNNKLTNKDGLELQGCMPFYSLFCSAWASGTAGSCSPCKQYAQLLSKTKRHALLFSLQWMLLQSWCKVLPS